MEVPEGLQKDEIIYEQSLAENTLCRTPYFIYFNLSKQMIRMRVAIQYLMLSSHEQTQCLVGPLMGKDVHW